MPGSEHLLAWSSDLKRGFTHKSSQGAITCLAASSASKVVITGHESGVIVVWHQYSSWVAKTSKLPFFSARSQSAEDIGEFIPACPEGAELPVMTVLHWHAHAFVESLCLSLDGFSVYSGGKEGVLVKWHLNVDAIDRKAFIPRLGSTILHLSPR